MLDTEGSLPTIEDAPKKVVVSKEWKPDERKALIHLLQIKQSRLMIEVLSLQMYKEQLRLNDLLDTSKVPSKSKDHGDLTLREMLVDLNLQVQLTLGLIDAVEISEAKYLEEKRALFAEYITD